MTDRFADTGGWAAWANGRDVFHEAAKQVVSAVWDDGGRLVTTSFVLVELTALFVRMKIPKPHQVEFFDRLAADPSVVVVPVTPVIEAEAWALWRSRLDKDWTLTDCASFVVMQQRGLTAC